ncbi:porin [Frateuria sp. Soil773]|uniref:OprO/OprP family phosphate-selective porin n=1 Tax=Frateuria sp. Soil773 TaxID=1736407 RepID=UPI0006FB2FF8|nr:porin [Frateuria sp. Soil773]KRE88531.1 porin [Frateuria sp. Soil773]
MRKPTLLASLALLLAARLAGATEGKPYAFADNWPTHHVFGDGTDLGLSLKYQYDLDRFSNDRGRLEDARTNRRKELGAYLKKPGVYDAVAAYDFQARAWLDVYLRMQSKAWFGRDAGALRLGFGKTPVGFEGNTGTGSTTFLETALPVQAIYAGRRIGIDWAIQRGHWLANAGYYRGGDLNGDNDGRMLAARFAWVPLNRAGNVLHLGVSASREWPAGSTDGRGIHTPPGTRLRARPEAGLADRLIDSGTLAPARRVERRGLEGVWIDGPWSVQGEYLEARVARTQGRPDFDASGGYVFASWVATGESRAYAGGNVGDVKPKGRYGALELALRYSELDLDDGPVSGGRQRDWTLGANWYLNRYLKLQANYVRAHSERRGLRVDPDVVELRAQVQF